MTDPALRALADRPMRRGAWWEAALDFCFPPACLVCRTAGTSPARCCPGCRKELLGDGRPVCQRCCAPVGPHLDTAAGCSRCRADRFAFERVYALGPYDGLLRSVCLRGKQDRAGLLPRELGEFLAERWGTDLRAWTPDLIVPIPSHWTTRFLRGSTHAATMAAALARTLDVPCDLHLLRKVRVTAPQATLPPSSRRENLKRAFALARGVSLQGGRILLVDDVLTTGTTAHRAAQVLRQGGADAVRVAVAARGLG